MRFKSLIFILILSTSLLLLPPSNVSQSQTTDYSLDLTHEGTASTQSSYPEEIYVQNDIAFVAEGNGGGLSIVDISIPSAPVQRSYLEMGKYTSDIVVQNDLAFVTSTHNTFIVNVSDVSSPEIINTIQTGANSYLDVVDNLLVTDGRIYDITDPQNVNVLYWFTTIFIANYKIEKSFTDDYLHILEGDTYSLYNITDPTNPQLMSDYTAPNNIERLVIDGDYTYTTVEFEGMFVFDTSNKSNITRAGVFSDPSIEDIDMLPFSNKLHMAVGSVYHIMDVSNKSEIVEEKNYNAADQINSITISGDYIFLAEGSSGIEIVDISGSTPSKLSTHDEDSNNIVDSFRLGNILYTIDTEEGLIVFSISDPNDPIEIGRYSFSNGLNIEINNDLAYVGTYGSLKILDISDPTSITQVNEYSSSGPFDDLNLMGSILYYSNRDKFVSLNVSDPNSLQTVNVTTFENWINDIAIRNSIAYVANGSQIETLDITNSSSPVILDSYSTALIEDIDVAGSYAYVLQSDRLYIVDISEPDNMKLEFDSSGSFGVFYGRAVSVSNNLMYVVEEQIGLTVFDISDPSNPDQVATISTSNDHENVHVDSQYIIVDQSAFGAAIITSSVVPDTTTTTETEITSETETVTSNQTNTQTVTSNQTNTVTETVNETSVETRNNGSVSTTTEIITETVSDIGSTNSSATSSDLNNVPIPLLAILPLFVFPVLRRYQTRD